MMQPFIYVGLLFRRASQRSVLLTDQLTILIVPFSTFALWLAGAKMTDSIQETLALGVAMTVMVVVVLRLAAASYFVWKDDQDEKRKFQRIIEDPDRQVDIALKEYTTERRKLLSEKLSVLSAISGYKGSQLSLLGINSDYMAKILLEIDALIHQLSYYPTLRVASIRLKEYCLALLTDAETDRGRLWAQRKLTFRLIHREDRIADIMTLIDIEKLSGDDYFGKDGEVRSIISELKDMIDKLGDEYYNPELEKTLKESLRSMDRG